MNAKTPGHLCAEEPTQRREQGSNLSNKQLRIQEKSIQYWLLFVTTFSTAWVILCLPHILSPWIWGVDSITRIVKIDRIIIWVLGNPWLPGYQLTLQALHALSSDLIWLKFAQFLISTSAILMLLWLFFLYFGLRASAFLSLYFLLHWHWLAVSCSFYMEPLALFFLSLTGLFTWHNRAFLAAFSLIAASFVRPEVLIASPALLFAHYIFFRKIKASILFAVCFLPISIYYLWLKYSYASFFQTPGKISPQELLRVAEKLFSSILFEPIFSIVFTFFVLASILLFIRPDLYAPHARNLKVALGALLIFLSTLLLVLPLGHKISSGGNRLSIMALLPVWALSSVYLDLLLRRRGEFARSLVIALCAIALTLRFSDNKNWMPKSYAYAEKIHRTLRYHGYQGNLLYLCRYNKHDLLRDDFHEIDMNPLRLYLQAKGWRVNDMECSFRKTKWRALSQEAKTPVLRLYRPGSIRKELEMELLKNCEHSFQIGHPHKPLAKACLPDPSLR